jgi:hypothetical protein|tara:strand:+ start:414 stop:1040 length:627 start_codon:yes stop_codon:yes gene_type:complete
MRSLLFAILTFSSGFAAAATELRTNCNYCSSTPQFAVHGAGALEVVEAEKSIYQRLLGIQPITVHNANTGQAARVEVSIATRTISFGLFNFSIPDTSKVNVTTERTNGADVRSDSISVQLIDSVIAARNIKASQVTPCERSSCSKLASALTGGKRAFDIRNIDVGEIHLGGEQFLWSWSPPSGGYVTGANYFNILWDNCSNCTTESIY